MRHLPIAITLPLLLAGCVAAPPLGAPAAGAARFDAIGFFTGDSRGTAMLKVAFKAPVPVHVASHGRIAADGTLILDQRIVEGDKPAKDRQWRIREIAPGRYAGSLSDAAGPVTGEATPGLLHLAFAMKGGLAADQRLLLATDGRSARNILTVGKFGFTVAVLDETIRRAP